MSLELRRVANQTPNDRAGKAGGLRFEHGQVTDAAFVQPASIVDHQDISSFGGLEGLQKNINAAPVLCGEDAARKPRATWDRYDARRSEAQGHAQLETCIGNQ